MSGGLRFNTGKLKWGLVSWRALAPMVQVLMYGAHKYTTFKREDGATITGADISVDDAKGLEVVTSGANNWKLGLHYVGITESLKRHLFAFIEGEDNDDESKISHVGHILCNALFLSYMVLFRKDMDDRYIDPNFKEENNEE
tara:strand:+ start:44429 stop:44854 length:426 start_codon:yes stop_codon:yes gene_type:complete